MMKKMKKDGNFKLEREMETFEGKSKFQTFSLNIPLYD